MKRRAFTLIELIAVLGIISIIFTLSFLKTGIVDQIGFENEVQTFVNDYNYSREKAMSTGGANWLRFDDASGYGSSDFKISRKLKYARSSNPSLSIRFDPNGNIHLSANQSFDIIFHSIKNPEKTRKFTIGAVGGYLSDKN